eukprot:g3516.t1
MFCRRSSSGESPSLDFDLSAASLIEKNDLVIFITTTCPFCKMAVESLREANFDPMIVVVSDAQRQELLEMTGKTSVPSAWVRGKYIGGCNDGPEEWMGVIPCIQTGRLSEMLAA